jgi:CarboxypepD_reg-like domain/TonB-dependent Receptor Plug Domain
LKYFYIFIFTFVLTGLIKINAQNYGTLRGFVRDSANGEILAYATIYLQDTKQGSTSDTRGFYSIPSILVGNHSVVFSYVGYIPKEVEVKIRSDKITEINVQLLPGSVNYNAIVKLGQLIKKPNENDAGLYNLTGKEIQIVPKGIEADVMRSLQMIPGVKTSNDVSSRYYVRGGGSDQNLVLLDGVTIYNPYHALGIFSIIDPEIINNVQFYKGTFPVEYGGRLSSVMNIRTNDGNRYRYSGSANASFLTGKVSLEGPIPDGSFLLTGRKSYFGEVMKNFLNNKTAPFDFYDMNMKLNYANDDMLKNSKFTIKTLISNDNINYGDPKLADYSFRNDIFGIDYFQVWEKPLYSNISFSVSNYHAAVSPNFSQAKEENNDVREFAWNNDFTFLFNSKDELGLGLQVRTFSSDLDYQNKLSNFITYSDFGANFDFYVKYKFLRFEKLGIEAGVRISPVTLTVRPSQLLFPNISLTYRIIPELAFKAAWGVYKQEIMAYTDDNNVVSIFEPYLIIPDYLSPSKAIHYMAGFDINISPLFNMEIESYYKTLLHIVDINQNKVFASDPDLISTNGESYGLEYTIKYNDDRLFTSVGYTLAWAFMGIDAVRYYPKYDSRHQVDLLAGWDFGGGWKASAVWTFNTGRPYTQSTGFYDKTYIEDFWNQFLTLEPTKAYTLLDGKNAARLPIYHRLDMSLSKELVLFFMKMTIEANIINVYNRQNIFYFDRSTGERINMLPFLPTLSLRVDI